MWVKWGTLCIVLLLLSAFSVDAKTKRRKVLARAEQENIACDADNECPYVPCKTSTCVDGKCALEDVICPLSNDPCVYSMGCDVASDQCRYSQLTCNDNNPCTVDKCTRNASSHSYCVHTAIPECDNSAVHSVTFRVENANHLNVNVRDNGNSIEFCQASTLVGADTSIVIGFDPYTPCQLHQRGTCDNKMSAAPTPAMTFITDPYVYDSASCTVDSERHSVTINELDVKMRWSEKDFAAFMPLANKNGVQIHGYLVDNTNPGLLLRIELTLEIDNGRAPIKELPDQCYDSANIDTILWTMYRVSAGTISAAHNSQYMGLVYKIDNGFAQSGHGASGKNQEWGMYMSFTATLASQPFDSSLEIYTTSVTGIMRANLVQKATSPVNYCGLFDEPRTETINDWVPTYNPATHSVTYCRNFTLNELLKCRAHGDKYKALFVTSGTPDMEDHGHVNFAGTIYQTTVQPQGECSVWENGMCGERIISTTSYNITVFTNTSGVQRVDVTQTDFEFNIEWLENRWTCCGNEDSGNIRVLIETQVSHGGRKLINPRINFAEETGYPLSFEEIASECDPDISTHCVQRWTLSSENGGNVIDFSGIKPLIWDVYEGKSIIAHVSALMTLRARHVGSQVHLNDGQVSAELNFYSDRNLQTPLEQKRIIDSTPMFASICLDSNRHLGIVVDQVSICYSLSENANEENCDQKVVLYSKKDPSEVSPNATVHAFEFISNPPSTEHCTGFSLLSKAYSKFKQHVHVEWSVQESTGDGGLIEMWHDDDDSDDWHSITHHSDYYHYHSYCPHSYAFDWDHYHCHEWHNDDGSVVLFVILLVVACILIFIGCFCTQYDSKQRRKHKAKKRKVTKQTVKKQSDDYDFTWSQ